MLTHPPLAAFAAAALLASPLQALADDESWHDRHAREYRWERHDHRHAQQRLIEKYDGFAGSNENARELVEGLRKDTEVELSKGRKTTSFKPATDDMGYGNVDMALGLAKASLATHGIHNPTPEQIKAALNGGTVTTKSGQRVTLPGVLKLRASGMGWGQVAHKLGVKVGDVKGHGHKHAKHHDRDDDDDRHHHRKHVKHDGKHKHDKHVWKHDRKDHDRDHGDRHEHRKHAHHHKPDWKHDRHERKHEHVKQHHPRPEFHRAKFERPHRPERPERPEKHHHRR